MSKNITNDSSFDELLESFLNGDIEELFHDKDKSSVQQGNLLWDKMPSINQIKSLFYSQFESCQYWGTYILKEGDGQGRELMDLAVCLSGSQFASIRYNICSALWDFWSNRYIETLILFLNDRDDQTRMVALSLLGQVPDKDFESIVCKLKKDEFTAYKLRHSIEYYSALRANNVELLSDIILNTNDQVLKRVDLLRNS